MAYTISDDGRYHIPIVDLGNRLQDRFGLKVVEHPAFGGVTTEHANNSHHYYDEAIDIQDHRGGDGLGAEGFNGIGYQQRTSNLRDLLGGSANEVLGPGDKDHDTHVHLGAYGGLIKLDQQQYDYLYGGNSGGQNATFAFTRDPSTPSPIADQTVAPATKSYDQMSASEINSAYDKMRMAGDVFKAQEEGMKMHKAHFNKR